LTTYSLKQRKYFKTFIFFGSAVSLASLEIADFSLHTLIGLRPSKMDIRMHWAYEMLKERRFVTGFVILPLKHSVCRHKIPAKDGAKFTAVDIKLEQRLIEVGGS
jgi:hypothetical protein